MKKTITTIFATVVAVSAFALTPDEAAVKASIESMFKAGQEGKLVTSIFEAMPTSHQKGFYDVSQAFAKKMDPMVWNSGVSVMSNFGKVLSTKSDFIVNSAMAKQVPSPSADACKKGDLKAADVLAAGKFFSSIASITLADIKSQPNAKALAAYLDSKIGKLPACEMPTYTIKTEQDGDIVVYFEGRTDGVEFEKVKGKWLPEELADPDFDDILEVINEEMNFATEEGQQFKMQAMMFSAMANGALAPVLQAKTQEEFDAAVSAIFKSLGF